MGFTVKEFKYKTDLGNLPTSAIVKTAVGRPYLCFILALKAAYCNRIASRLQNSWVFFFSKSVKKSVKRGVKRGVRVFSVFRLVPDLLFDCSRVLEYAKYGLFCSLNCKTHSDISKLTETRKNRGTEKSVLLPCNNQKEQHKQ